MLRTKMTGITAALLLACGASALAQDTAYTWIQFHRVYLRNGNCVEGSLVSRCDASVTLRQPWGDILIRNDQIDRVEFVKMKSFKDPAIIVQRHVAPAIRATMREGSAEAVAAAALAERLGDSPDGVPAGIPKDVVLQVDRAINIWKSAVGSERLDLPEVLRGIGAEAIPYLEFLLEKRTQSTPLPEVARALVSLDEERFIDFSKAMMAAPSPEVRTAAMTALAQATSPRRLPLILKAMEDDDPSVWKLATEALLTASKRPGDKVDLVDWIGSRIAHAKNKTALVVVLGRIGGREARRVLWDLVGDSDETNRLTGLHGLGIIADSEDGERLVALLRDASDGVRKSTCLALGKVKYGPAVGDLIGILSDENSGLSKNARWALHEITGQIVPDNNQAWTEWWQVSGSKTDRFKH